MTPRNKSHSGQALIEYLLVFCFVAFFSFNIIKGLSKSVFSTVGFLGYELTEQLSVGVCETLCFMGGGYKNYR